MAKPAVILVGADKGGVGKTTVSRALLDYLIAHNIPTRAFDTEFPKGTLRRFHPDITEVVDLTSTADQMKVFDSVSAASAQITVIDVRAGLLSTTLKALRDIGFLDAAKKSLLTFGVFHILGPSVASLDEIAETSGYMGELSYFLVKNFINNTTFFEWDPATYNGLFQEDQRRPGDHRSETQRDGLRTGRACVGAVRVVRGEQGNRHAVRQLFFRAARLCPALAR